MVVSQSKIKYNIFKQPSLLLNGEVIWQAGDYTFNSRAPCLCPSNCHQQSGYFAPKFFRSPIIRWENPLPCAQRNSSFLLQMIILLFRLPQFCWQFIYLFLNGPSPASFPFIFAFSNKQYNFYNK